MRSTSRQLDAATPSAGPVGPIRRIWLSGQSRGSSSVTAVAKRARRVSQLVAMAGVSVLLVLLVWRLTHQSPRPTGGGPAPRFILPYLSKPGRLDLASLRGHPVVLSFWASWCEPCKAEAGTLERLSRRYETRGVRFVGVDTNDGASDARRFVRAHGLTYPIVRDANGAVASNEYAVANLPTTFFINRYGVLIGGDVLGPVTDSDRAKLFRHYLRLAMKT